MARVDELFDEIEEIECILEDVIYRDEDDGYLVAKVSPADEEGNRITAVGNMASAAPGQHLQLRGKWVVHPKYGQQFKVVDYKVGLPASKEGIKKYLSSGLIKGIGPAIAARIVDRWGEKTLEIIEEDPDRLAKVEGIGPHRLKNIKKAWKEQEDIREVMLFLKAHDVSTNYGLKIYKTYGEKTLKIVRGNPYQLTEDIFGIGFKTADRIATKLGVCESDPDRIKAGVEYTLRKATDEGHVFLPRSEVLKRSQEILGVPKTSIQEAANELFHQERIIIEQLDEVVTDKKIKQAVYLAPFFFAERGVAARLKAINSTPSEVSSNTVDKLIGQLEKQESIQYNQDQKGIIKEAILSKVMVITGGPGTGKTTAIKGIIRVMDWLSWKVNLAAPTGRAAKRLSQATGREATTIHRMLKFRPPNQFGYGIDNQMKVDAVIIDELSMVDLILMYNLLKAVPDRAHFILVGDADQLPSVGAGNVLNDLISSKAIKVGKLTEIFRQAEESKIVINAHLINQGQFPQLASSKRNDFFFIQKEDSGKAAQVITHLASEQIPLRFNYDPFDEVQVLTPMHRGPSGVDHLNDMLQHKLNPRSDLDLPFTSRRLRVGDKVMQIRNNYQKDVFNGDIGKITDIDRTNQRIFVHFPARGVVPYQSANLNELVLAYAITIHKSQGNEYKAVIIPMLTQHYIMLQRNLLYTALTRAKELAVIVGSKKAVGIAVNNDKEQLRYSYLAKRLRERQK